MTSTAAAPTAAPRPLDPERLGDHFDRLYRAALAMCGCPHTAQDLVQETYEKVLKRPRMLRNDDDLGYLLSTLRNVHVSSLRAAARRPRGTDAEIDLELFSDRVSPAPHEAVEHREILAAVGALDAPFRDAVVAVDVAGLSCREAARALKVREGTIMSRLFRARRKLADVVTG